MTGPRILAIDIETTPLVVHSWSLFDLRVGLNQLLESTSMFCFAARWADSKKTEFWSVHHNGREAMIQRVWDLLDEADIVMGWNSRRFDVPHINRELLQAGLTPPSPFKHLDLMQQVKRTFKFPSNKLDYVSKTLLNVGKVRHEGHDLWVQCLAGDEAAWRRMRTYNKRDVDLLIDLRERLLPWLVGHPNLNLYADEPDQHLCPRCGSANLTKQGYAYTSISRFQQWRCSDCGSWSRSGKRDGGSDLRAVAS
jgi:DNA polymerase elongation subunit (family B)